MSGLHPALDMFQAALDILLAVGPFEESDLVGVDSPLVGKGNLEVEVVGHLVREDILQVVVDSYQVVADSPRAVVGNFQAVVGNLQAAVGNLQAEKRKPQEEQNLQGLGRAACLQSRPFPHWRRPLLSVVVTQSGCAIAAYTCQHFPSQ